MNCRPKTTIGVVALLFVATISPVVSAQQAVDERRQLTLEEIHHSSTFSPAGFEGGKWAEEGPIITYVEDDADTGASHLVSYNLETGTQERLIDGSNLYARDVDRLIKIEGYEYSSDKSKVLIYTDSEQVWRYKTKGYYYIYDIETRRLTPISDRERGFQMFAKFSPDGKRVGFVRDRNLFVMDVEDMKERQLTFDGAEGGIINGTSDWVYEEEFGLRDGWAWGPDGRLMAYVQLDESGTRDFVMTDLLGQYPDLERFRYPKAGEVNSEIRVGVVDVLEGDHFFFDTGTWNEGGDSLEYIPTLGWTPEMNGTAYVWMFRLNRDQNHVDLLYGDPSDGSVDVVLEEKNQTWIDVETSFGDLAGGTITYLEDDERFVWMSERDGYRHLYLYQNDGTFLRQLTDGPWNVTNFHGIDVARDAMYFTGTIESPLERHLYRSRFSGRASTNGGGEPEQITRKPGWHIIDMSRDLRYYIDRFSDVATPSLIMLHRADGSLVKVLEDNEELLRRLAEYDLPYPEFLEVPGADGVTLNAYLIKPKDFDPSKTYPLLMYVYGGPGSQTVQNAWGGSRYLWHAYLAEEHDVLVASVDNRGTGGKSKAFKSVTYETLGIIEARDQIAAAEHLSLLPYVDASRTGIWGWSYGGYMTMMSMLYGDGPETFELGVSVAPVTDWRQYDTIYTERYMSTPQKNPEGYRQSSPLSYADRLRENQDLLIIHGDLDDNVHFQNTMQMVNALQEAGRQFQFMVYPGRNHGIYGGNTRLHLFTLATDFIVENL